MEILIDACAIMAVIIKEPERDLAMQLTQNAIILAPDMVSYEIANALTKLMKRKLIEKEDMVNAYDYFKRIPITTIAIDIKKALEIAWKYNIYSYDSCYLEAALRLNLPLLTFDSKMIDVGKDIGIKILGGKNVDI